MDSEVIVNLIARSKAETQVERIADAARQIEGAFSLIITTTTPWWVCVIPKALDLYV